MNAIDKRRLVSRVVLILSSISALIGLLFLFWILGVLILNGIESIRWDLFVYEGAPPGMLESGLKHALIGQLILVGCATLIGVPIGILGGTYLSEYAGNSRFGNFVRDISDIMMSAPSIVIGAFVYAVVVLPMGHFSGIAGVVALSIIMIPIILRTTDDMLQLVSPTLREAAYALGAPKYRVILSVVYRGAKAGVLTGIILGVARVAGETAPLLFTSFNDNFSSTDLMEPMASLTVTIYNYATSPYADWQSIGWAAAFMLSMFILALNIIGRLIILKRKGA